jgi:hypothetical protein
MPKYYINCGTLKIIHSTSKTPEEAAIRALWETNASDVLDEHFYIDEKGYKDYYSANPETVVILSSKVIKLAGWEMSGDDCECLPPEEE